MQAMNQTRLQMYALLIFIALAGGAWIHATRVPSASEIIARTAAHVGFRAPEFSLTSLEGSRVSSNDLRGKVVLINFWATWCIPCRAEMPDLQATYLTHQADDFIVLAINNAEDPETVRKFVEEFHLTLPILLDPDGAAAKSFRVQALPTSFFIDREGIIRATNVGGMNRAHIETTLARVQGAR
jgi:peroxiredoxin